MRWSTGSATISLTEGLDLGDDMRKTIVAGAFVGALALAGASLVAPGLATAEPDGGASSGVGGERSALQDALDGLVSDGTLSQEQADEVATALDEALPWLDWGGFGHGPEMEGFDHGPGMGGWHAFGGFDDPLDPSSLAELVGVTVEELDAAMREGTTLAELAESNGVSKEALVERLVAQAEERLAEDVADGRLTQEQADEWRAGLETFFADMVDLDPSGLYSHFD